jgi:hypothetical protein
MIGIKTFENGTRDEREFADYQEMVQWLAESPEAGVAAYAEDGSAIDQHALCADIEAV